MSKFRDKMSKFRDKMSKFRVIKVVKTKNKSYCLALTHFRINTCSLFYNDALT